MSKASLEAGLAFSQTATTAPHSVSYPMTSYFNLSHGFACALTLPEFLLYNHTLSKEDCLDKREYKFVKEKLERLADHHLGFNNLNYFYNGIKNLMKKINAPLKLSEAGINDIEIILNEGFNPKRIENNPRKVTKESLKKILEKIK
jgi:alcohol dehydrogenase